MPFYKKKQEKFRTGKLDILVIIIVLCVFFWALLFDSFKPATNETGEIMRDAKGEPLIKINLQLIFAPLILCYEMMLMLFEGKYRGRYLPWGLYYQTFKYMFIMKMREGKQQYIDWRHKN